jgi:CRISPR-associated endonuclease/helicase Cas3
MRISLLPVFSRLADPSAIPAPLAAKLPNWQLSQHQLATYEALTDPEVSIVINTAMTGDGKSLAGQLPFLVDRDHTILAHYPTNELVEDQYTSAISSMAAWGVQANRLSRLSANVLDELWQEALESSPNEQYKPSRSDTLMNVIENYRVVFSNPDIFHAILQFHYQQPGRAITYIANALSMEFRQFTFDEFHVFDTPEITAVLIGLLFLLTQQPAQQQHLKVLFLSATPDERLIKPLNDLGLGARLRVIAPQREGWYAYGSAPDAMWRPILQGATLQFEQKRAEEWLDGMVQTLSDWFQQHGKGAKAAVIVRSVASALRIVQALRERLPAHIRVESNTGIDGRAQRKQSYEAEVLVGTSTVDVGVDFRINLLIFEADSASQFMQRLGRLGRHTHYTDAQGVQHQFHAFHAVALVAPYVYERLFAPQGENPARLEDGQALQRDTLSSQIAEAFNEARQFPHYARLWGRFQAVQVIRSLRSKTASQSFQDVVQQLSAQYRKLTGSSTKQTLLAWEDYLKNKQGALIKSALQFRGSSPFQAAVLRLDQAEPSIVTYDLFWLLANADLELLTKEQFEREVARYGLKLSPSQARYITFYFRWKQLFEINNTITIKLPPKVGVWDEQRMFSAQVLPGFGVQAGHQPFVKDLEPLLLKSETAALLIPDATPLEAKRTYYLPFLMPLFPYIIEGDTRTGSIAFGRDALLLDSFFHNRKRPDDKSFMC